MTDEERAMHEVLLNIIRQEPYVDCNQCSRYIECSHKSLMMEKCTSIYHQRKQDWIARKERWLKAMERYYGQTSS